ncbi:hypothetical protein SDJN02_24336, partial [Cucurbita argyrosperma subsp. argyrosperma]
MVMIVSILSRESDSFSRRRRRHRRRHRGCITPYTNTVVSTLDSESSDLSSTLGRTFLPKSSKLGSTPGKGEHGENSHICRKNAGKMIFSFLLQRRTATISNPISGLQTILIITNTLRTTPQNLRINYSGDVPDILQIPATQTD